MQREKERIDIAMEEEEEGAEWDGMKRKEIRKETMEGGCGK